MLLDHFHLIGQDHVQEGSSCQDHAYSEELTDGRLIAVVADGCSGAQGDSSVGARAIAAACQRALVEGGVSPDEWFDSAFFARLHARFNALRVGKKADDYYASLVALCATPTSLRFYVFGDGAFAVTYADGSVKLTTVDWWRNRPYYLAYLDDSNKDEPLREAFRELGVDPIREEVTRFLRRLDGAEILSQEERWRGFAEFEKGHCYTVDLTETPARAAVVLTDGIRGFDGASTLEVAALLLHFPESRADFVRRQLVTTVTRFSGRGQYAMDDIAMAGLLF